MVTSQHINAVSDWLLNLARESRAFRIVAEEPELSVDGRKVDLLVTIALDGSQRKLKLAIEIRKRVTPREAVAGVRVWREQPSGTLPILCCPYISPRVAEICEEAGVGYLDQAGNCRLRGPGLYLHVEGRPNPRPETRALSNPFAPKSSRIVRLLLLSPERPWQVQELSQEAQVSMGLVSKAKDTLMEEGYLWQIGGFLRLGDPSGLLRAWSDRYQNTAEQRDVYVMGDTNEIERRVQHWCDRNSVRCGLAGLSGAWRRAPMVRYNRPTFYVETSRERRVLAELMVELDAKQVESGANLSLWATDDPTVFRGRDKFDDIQVMSALQLYLDLTGQAGRAEEAAQEIYDRCLAEPYSHVAQKQQSRRT